MLMMTLALLMAPQTASPTPAPAPQAATAGEERKICRKVGVTGSRVSGKRVCHTAEEWRQMDLATQESLRQSNGNGR